MEINNFDTAHYAKNIVINPVNLRLLNIAPQELKGDITDFAETIDDTAKDPEVTKAIARVDALQKETNRIESALKFRRKDRFNQFPNLYNSSREKAMEPHRLIVKGIIFGTFFGGAVLGMATRVMGLDPRIGTVIGIATIIGAFSSRFGTGRIYVEAIKKLVIPGKTDEIMKNRLNEDLSRKREALENVRASLGEKSLDAMKKITGEKKDQKVTSEEGPDFVDFDGVKLKKNLHRSGDSKSSI